MDDRKRAEALLRRLGKQPQPSYVEEILAAFAEERRLERENVLEGRREEWSGTVAGKCIGCGGDRNWALNGQAQAICHQCASRLEEQFARAEAAPPQGAPTASAIRAEGTHQPEPLREALDAVVEWLNNGARKETRGRIIEKVRSALAAAPSVQPQEEPRCAATTRNGHRCDKPPHEEGNDAHEAENAAEGGATLVWTEVYPGKVPERRATEAPEFYSKHEAKIWTDGFNAALRRVVPSPPTPQASETPLNTRTARSADGLPVVDFDRDALADGSGDFADGTMETPLGGPTGTQASETPLEPEFAHTHTETFADAMREFGHAQASETPAEGVRYRAETIDAWSKSYDELCDVLFPESVGKPRMIGWKHLIARASELARRPHGR